MPLVKWWIVEAAQHAWERSWIHLRKHYGFMTWDYFWANRYSYYDEELKWVGLRQICDNQVPE